MKSKRLFSIAIAISVFVMYSCEKEDVKKDKVTFEDFSLDSSGVYIGKDQSGGFTEGNAHFKTNYSMVDEFEFWSGFAVSNHTDATTPGFVNQFSAVAGSGADQSEKYVVLYSSGKDTIEFLVPEKITNISFCNSTYTYYAIKDGTQFSEKFGEGDFFNLIIELFDESKRDLARITLQLADFTDGNELIGNVWTDVDLSQAGYVKYVVFSFESSDVGEFGINTPTYVCIDNIFGELQE